MSKDKESTEFYSFFLQKILNYTDQEKFYFSFLKKELNYTTVTLLSRLQSYKDGIFLFTKYFAFKKGI